MNPRTWSVLFFLYPFLLSKSSQHSASISIGAAGSTAIGLIAEGDPSNDVPLPARALHGCGGPLERIPRIKALVSMLQKAEQRGYNIQALFTETRIHVLRDW